MTTQYANASYQEVIDLHTESDRVSVVGIHTPCSDTPYHMLKGFWEQFRKFKYNGCSVSLVPAAQLPADPLQVSYEAGEPTIDPRDMLNPILFHGCHGDDMGAILNDLYADPASGAGQIINTELSDSTDHNLFIHGLQNVGNVGEVFESLYYRALTDKTWLKAHPQRGFRKSGLHPMVYSVASTVQFAPNGGISGTTLEPTGITHDPDDGSADSSTHGIFGRGGSDTVTYQFGGYGRPKFVNDGGAYSFEAPGSRSNAYLLTPRLQRLGWMDTRQVVGVTRGVSESAVLTEAGMKEALTKLYLDQAVTLKPVLTPKIFMAMIMLPPAYKTEQHFRLVLNHSFSFAKFRGASMQYNDFGSVAKAYPYFDFHGGDDSKHIDPEPEPDPKDGVKDGSYDKQ